MNIKQSLLVILIIIAGQVSAKLQYIPNYYSSVSLEEDTLIVTDSTYLKECALSPKDGHFTIFVMHDTITKERIKAIHRNEAAKALSTIGLMVGATASIYSVSTIPLSPINALLQSNLYTSGLNVVGLSSYGLFLAENKLDALHQLPISILICNNTNREMYVNDLVRGLIWYIRPYQTLTLKVGNPEINTLRIAYADTTEPHVAYATIAAVNTMDEVDMLYENDQYWIFDVYNKRTGITKTKMRDKQTQKTRTLSREVADSIINEFRKQEK